jgi:hypothetical protein
MPLLFPTLSELSGSVIHALYMFFSGSDGCRHGADVLTSSWRFLGNVDAQRMLMRHGNRKGDGGEREVSRAKVEGCRGDTHSTIWKEGEEDTTRDIFEWTGSMYVATEMNCL